MQKIVFTLALLVSFATVPAWGQRYAPIKHPSATTTAAIQQPVAPPPLLTPPPAAPTTITPPPAPPTINVPPTGPQPVLPPPVIIERKVSSTVDSFSPGELRATPEMWFYEQNMKEYKDPKTAVRAKAEFDARQRERRLASMRWFGLSNSRPRMGSDPVNVYPPAWSSNTPLQPNRWQATGGQPYYVARPDSSELR